jgi:hypothetical protein
VVPFADAQRASFTLMGVFNGALLVAALLVRWRAGAPAATQTTTPELPKT